MRGFTQPLTRDAFVSEICQSVSLPLVHVPAKRAYSVQEIRELIRSAFGETPNSDAIANPMPEAAERPICPKCGSPMVRRITKKGVNAGRAFLGCSAYPKCMAAIGPEAKEPQVPT